MGAKAIPNNLPNVRALATVPEATFRCSGASTPSWVSEYNVAAWLGFRYPPKQALGIVLRYRDKRGEHCLLVDECTAPDGLQLMLSGRAQINAVGKISAMSVDCCGLEPGVAVRIDELFVQRVEETAAMLRRARFAANQ